MANWIAGYWFAKQFGLKFAHLPFSNQKWYDFLGFGGGKKAVSELKKEGYKIRKLPLFSEQNINEMKQTRNIISSYARKNTVFVCEQDQFYHAQFGVMDDLREKFRNASARKSDNIEFDRAKFNIAVHVRRSVIIDNKAIEEENACKKDEAIQNAVPQHKIDTLLRYVDTEREKIFREIIANALL